MPYFWQVGERTSLFNSDLEIKKLFSDEELLAGATGFEPAILALTGPHVRPLHHAPERPKYYHTPL
jgi:hypothetical protein